MATKLIAFGITALVVVSLIVAGNVQAFDVQISPDDRSTAGNTINFHADLSDALNVTTVTVTAGNLTCNFDKEGTPLAPCNGIELKKQSEQFGYGESKDLKYKITLDRNVFGEGSYDLTLTANTAEGPGSATAHFDIKSKGKSSSAPGKNK